MLRGPTPPRAAIVALLVAGGCECGPSPPPPAPDSSAPERTPAEVTILYTSDEHGWLLPFDEDGVSWGGAGEVLARWIADEGHCPGPAPEGDVSSSLPACADPGTLALSGGDGYTGPAVSSYYGGAPMAEALARMGYAAAALGNHDFDFGRAQFAKNRERSRIHYLASNVTIDDPGVRRDVGLAPFAIFVRRGIKIGVVGLSTDTTLTEAKPSNFVGLSFGAEEQALDDAIGQAWEAGPDALVVLAHECADRLTPIFERHPEWRVAFVGAAHCHRVIHQHVGAMSVISPGWRLQHYVRVRLRVDPALAPKNRTVAATAEIVDVKRPLGAAEPSDGPLATAAAGWKKKLDDALGETIGYTRTGFAKGSPDMVRWVTGAWRDEFKVDVGLLNKGALRQALAPGPITKASVWSILPFDNTLVIGSLTGKDLAVSMENEEACAAGLRGNGPGLCLASGTPIKDDARYSVVTFDFLYAGGANFALRAYDPTPKETGLDWREPVVEWTRRLATSSSDPLEHHLP